MQPLFRFATLAGLCIAALPVIAQETPEVRLSVAGLQVIRERVPAPHGFGFPLTPFQSFNDRGVKIALMLVAPEGEIAAFDYRNCGVKQFADDEGNPLRISPIDFMSTEIARNRKVALVEIESPGLPARGAKFLKTKGAVGVLYGEQTATVRSEPLEIKQDARLEAGDYEFRVVRIEVDRKETATYRRVILVLDRRAPEIRTVQFLEERENGFKGTSNSGRGGSRDETCFYFHFEGELPRPVNLIVETWSDLKPLVIPFDLEVAAGL